jgi:predicted transcriptional regulator
MPSWSFLTNHALALLCIRRDPDSRIRDVADCLGVTERAAHRILCDLCAAGYLEKTRIGARNHYVVNLDGPMRHPLVEERQVRELVEPLAR